MPENSENGLDVEDLPAGEPVALETPASRNVQFFVQFARELVRGSLAFGLLILFAGTVWFCIKQVGTPAWKDTKDLLAVLLPTESALLGSAIAFFFGGKARS